MSLNAKAGLDMFKKDLFKDDTEYFVFKDGLSKIVTTIVNNLKSHSNVTMKLSEGLEEIDNNYISTDKKNRLYYDKLILTIPREHLVKLEKTKPVVFTGDLNVAHQEIDLARPKQHRHNPGFSDEERVGFDNIVSAGFIDTFRHLHPDEPEHYSWWSYRANARANNVGWRIDYFCISPTLLPSLAGADIHSDTMGSDHCPVVLELDF